MGDGPTWDDNNDNNNHGNDNNNNNNNDGCKDFGGQFKVKGFGKANCKLVAQYIKDGSCNAKSKKKINGTKRVRKICPVTCNKCPKKNNRRRQRRGRDRRRHNRNRNRNLWAAGEAAVATVTTTDP